MDRNKNQTHSVSDILNFYGKRPPLPAHLKQAWKFLDNQYEKYRAVHIICDARLVASLIICIKSKYIATVTTSHASSAANSTQSCCYEVKIIMNETITKQTNNNNVMYINCKFPSNTTSATPTIHL